MTHSSLADTLKILADSSPSRSLAARLRDVFPEIEQALQKGVSRSTILKALQNDGMEMSMKTFESALYRMRKAKSPLSFTKSPSNEVAQTTSPVKAKPTETPIIKSKEAPVRLKPLTPADFQKIRDDMNNMDLDALIRSKGTNHTEPRDS